MTGPSQGTNPPTQIKRFSMVMHVHESNESSISLLSHVSGYPSMLDTLYVSRHIIPTKRLRAELSGACSMMPHQPWRHADVIDVSMGNYRILDVWGRRRVLGGLDAARP